MLSVLECEDPKLNMEEIVIKIKVIFKILG